MPSLNVDMAYLPIFWQWVVYTGIIMTAILAIIGFARKIWPLITKFVTTVSSLDGLPEFMAATAATLSAQDAQMTTNSGALDAQAAMLEVVHHEVQYNNGSSVKDAVNRIEATQVEIRKGIEGLYKRAEATDEQAADLQAALGAVKPARRRTSGGSNANH
jgi:hypothetical protein